MSNAAPPPWVLALDLDSGSWRCLVGLWMFAAYGVTGPTIVWPSRKTLAKATGQKAATVARQLQKLATAGLIRRLDGTRIELAWRAPDDYSTGSTTLVVDDYSPPPDDSGAPPDDHSHRPPTTTVAPNLQGTSNLTSSDVEEDARPPSESITGKPRTLDTRTPAKQPPRHTPGPGAPELPGHVERSLARAQRRTATSSPRTELTPLLVARIAATSQGARLALDWPNWTRSLGEARAALTLTDDEIVAVLEAWPGAPRSERPDMDKLWWSKAKSRDWIKRVLAARAPAPTVGPVLSLADAQAEAYR